ncbi:MAG: serine/threonine protein kinase [Planctomycetes bacterium]|nr:serine/threonine protein kinase [Planctomycetota bacterium]
MIGERLGNWIIEAEIGQNDMGRLFRARAADDPTRFAAIKWLTHSKAKSPEFHKLFLAQIELLRKLQHANIVPVFEGGLHEGTPYLVREWVDGNDFETLLKRGEKPAWPEVLTIALRIVPALRHAHRRSVLHRNLKPSNLFRTTDGRYLLADFGLTKFFGDALLTSADQPLGSVAFLSPEQAAGKPHTKRSDFYALGGLLYALIVGRAPFTGSTVVELTHKHSYVLPERPLHFVNDLPEELDRLVMKLLAKEPAQRPGSGTLLIQEFEGIWSLLERRGLLPKRPATVPPETDEPPEEDPAPEPLIPEPIPHAPVPWSKRWYFVVPLFLGCVVFLLWAFYWRVPSADELMSKAKPLLASENPADWDTAWRDYLEPLSRKHPGKYTEEIKEARRRIDLQGEFRQAFLTGKSVRYRSEAERFYHEGLRMVQAGEFVAARRIWENLIKVHGGSDQERHWVALAADGIERLGSTPSTSGELMQRTRPVVEEIQRLRVAGKKKEADDLARSLDFLYRDDPEIETLRRVIFPMKD